VAKSYHEQEGLVFEQLSKLCRDTAFFKSYIAASFIVARDTLQVRISCTKRRALATYYYIWCIEHGGVCLCMMIKPFAAAGGHPLEKPLRH